MELTVFLLGIIAAVLGFAVKDFLLKPIVDFKNLTTAIGTKLTYYSNVVTSPGNGKLAEEASPVIRSLAIDLESAFLAVAWKLVFEKLRLLPKRENIIEARSQMIFISNSVHFDGKTNENMSALKKVFTLLNIKELEERYNGKL